MQIVNSFCCICVSTSLFLVVFLNLGREKDKIWKSYKNIRRKIKCTQIHAHLKIETKTTAHIWLFQYFSVFVVVVFFFFLVFMHATW